MVEFFAYLINFYYNNDTVIHKDAEKPMALDVSLISQKTSREQVQEYSTDRWKSDGRKRIAADIANNVRELLAGRIDIDFDLFLNGIRTERQGVYHGKDAIAMDGAQLIGAMAAGGNWATHDPPIVYLSARLLADMAESGGEIVRQSAFDYGQKVLPHGELYMKILDFLLELPNKKNSWPFIRQVEGLLGKGDIEGAYKIMMSRDDLVRRRG